MVKVVVGNSGDRAGIANIREVRPRLIGKFTVPILNIRGEQTVFEKEIEVLAASYYSYTFVPAYEIVEKDLLVKNVFSAETIPVELEVILKIECGSYDPRNGKYLPGGTIEQTLKVSLGPRHKLPE